MNPLKCFTKSCSTRAGSINLTRKTYLHHLANYFPTYIKDFPKFEATLEEEYQKRIDYTNTKAKQDFDEIFQNTKEFAEKTWQFVT
jgi:hypothetical protein